MHIVVITRLENPAVVHIFRRMFAFGIIALAASISLNPIFHTAGVIVIHPHDLMRRSPVADPNPQWVDFTMVFRDSERVGYSEVR